MPLKIRRKDALMHVKSAVFQRPPVDVVENEMTSEHFSFRRDRQFTPDYTCCLDSDDRVPLDRTDLTRKLELAYPPTLLVNAKPDNSVHQDQKTATAGSDVVQSGRPIFDDFFQHLWPYIGNNTVNVVFQMVKRLWLILIDQ
ncbi:hypothetical protein TNCV_1224491 [Trichonephila clavipes]|nr:hypothetical protein TNCV_1224491 [Trichonephila clavipes]